MPDIRAKFFVAEVHRTANQGNDGGGKVILRAAGRGAVNASFAAATPSGELSMFITRPEAFRFFDERLGREFYLDFTEYHPEPGDGHKFVESPEGHYNRPQCAECGNAREVHASEGAAT